MNATVSLDHPPRDRAELKEWLLRFLGLRVPDRPFVPGHSAPFEYLRHAFFEGCERLPEHDQQHDVTEDPSPADCVVWASRGGGKTFLGAVATLLDLLFKPEIEIRILGRSLDQSSKMGRYLRTLLDRDGIREQVRKVTERRIEMKTGAGVELLAQSETSVRGTRVQKLRCDEVDLFDPEVWEAAQLTTRSRQCGDIPVRGAIECLSTMHRAHGVMRSLVDEAKRGTRRLMRWSVLDVLEKCPLGCAREGACRLGPVCAGRGVDRETAGHVTLDDALTMRSRVSEATWEAEMLCEAPSREDAVLPEFDPEVHVFRSELPHRMLAGSAPDGARWLCGMDFGFRAPTVILWAVADALGGLWIVDERVEREVIVEEHARAILDGPWPKPVWIGVDPAGRARNGQTGETDVQVLQRFGLPVRARKLTIQRGLAMIRARLRPADGSQPRLHIHERCTRLIEAMETHHYDINQLESESPIKDGTDHAVDALRYLIINLDAPHKTVQTWY